MEIEPIEEGQILIEAKKDEEFYDKKKKRQKKRQIKILN